MSGKMFCYNTGCGKEFFMDGNDQDSCVFHSGAPFFHDAYKGWSCCGKKVTDFTEFLNIKGCTKGPHNPDKPPPPEKPKPTENNSAEEAVVCSPKPPPKPAQSAPREDGEQLMRELKTSISPQLLAKLDEKTKELGLEAGADEQQEDGVTEGTACKNHGCQETFGSGDVPSPCQYHPGIPVFHEGMKFWSCCKKRTTEFDDFLQQQGCAVGEHRWRQDKEASKLECRHDWHQTGSLVTLTIYCKNSHPRKSRVRASRLRLEAEIEDMDGKAFELPVELWGAIDPDASTVSLTPSKMEIKLRKAELISWSKLDYVQ